LLSRKHEDYSSMGLGPRTKCKLCQLKLGHECFLSYPFQSITVLLVYLVLCCLIHQQYCYVSTNSCRPVSFISSICLAILNILTCCNYTLSAFFCQYRWHFSVNLSHFIAFCSVSVGIVQHIKSKAYKSLWHCQGFEKSTVLIDLPLFVSWK